MTLLLVNVNAQVVMHTIAVWHVVCISVVRWVGYCWCTVENNWYSQIHRHRVLCSICITTHMVQCEESDVHVHW